MTMERSLALELLPEFALGLLEDDEATELAALLSHDEGLRAQLQVFLQAADALAAAPPEVAVPEGLRARVAAGTHAKIAALQVDGRPGRAPDLRPASAPKVARGPWRSIAVGAAAAAFVLASGLVVVGAAWLDARDDVDRLEGQLAARPIALPLTGPDATGTIFVASDFQGGVARLVGLAPAPAAHHYQIWSEGPSGALAAASFAGTADAQLLVELPPLPGDMTRMFVTIEPDGASGAAPTGPEVLSTGP